jgi:DNA-binding response OmpR family regulator
MKILIVEDDISIRNVLRMGLVSESHIIDEAENGESGSYFGRINKYDVIILDNVLPKKMGRQVCKEIREAGIHSPILLLSAKSDVNSKIELLNSGADDYLTKPFSFEELKARLRTLTRRPHRIEDVILKVAGISLNTNTGEVYKENKRLSLTKKEFNLLELLMKNSERIISRPSIAESIWDTYADPFSNTVEAHIRNVRMKIGDKKKNIIKNIPGRGYMMTTPKL